MLKNRADVNGICLVSGPNIYIKLKARHIPWHLLEPRQAGFLCGDSDYFLALWINECLMNECLINECLI